MRKENMRFGTFIKSKRLEDSRELTLQQVANEVGWSLSMLSDIEQNRRRPTDNDKLEKLYKFLNFSEEDIALACDLAAKETGEVPADIEDVFMYTSIGQDARTALRLTNAGIADEADWKKFIQTLVEKKKQEGK